MTRRLLPLLLALGLSGCGGDAPDPTPTAPTDAPTEAPVTPAPAPDTPEPDELGPVDTLEAWITAQEEGDFGWAMTYIVEDRHDEWAQMSEHMSTDDLIMSGLQFRDEDYQLNFADDRLAVFWSDFAKLYLVMVNENGQWKVDPGQTDEMNMQAGTP